MTQLTIVLACQESAGVHALELAVERGHRVAAVLTDPTRERSDARSVAHRAAMLGVDVRPATLLRDAALASWVEEQSVDLLLNVHSLYRVAPAVIDAPTIGSFNLHPGPLPAYAGLNAPSWGIFEGARSFGCTLHWMSATIDSGPIAYVTSFPLRERDTGLTVTARCVREGLGLLGRLIDDAAAGGPRAIPRQPQDGAPVDRGPGPPQGGRVSWTMPADRIAAFARACDYGPYASPWGRPIATFDGEPLGLVRATVASTASRPKATPGEVLAIEGDDALVAAGGDTVLRLARVTRRGEIVAAAGTIDAGARFVP